MELRCLESILNYEMTSREAKAYKICCIYYETLYKVFPNSRHYRRQRKGDPRKSTLFKYCIKLLRETEQIIDDRDYVNYVRAQMEIIKAVTAAYQHDANVGPSCLVGKKAWNRWLVWKKKYEARLEKVDVINELTADPNTVHKVKVHLRATKSFLTKKLGSLTKENLKSAVEGRSLLRWVAIQDITPYYVLLSPILNEWLNQRKLDASDIFHIDFDFYRPVVTKEVQSFFKEEFSYEY